MGKTNMKVAIIGCGLIGQKRARALGSATLIACVDSVLEKAKGLASQFPGCIALSNWQDVVKRADVDIVIVATVHKYLAEIVIGCIKAHKHVLVEKPAARISTEIEEIINVSNQSQALVRVGFNHRYHPAFRKARDLINQNELGPLLFIRARYGHGGRLGYEKEWRAQSHLSGGGELIDQGIHLIDLARWFLGDFTEVEGFAHTYFWDMPVEDNGFLLLKTKTKQVAFLHASCTEWKNLFSFEIYGSKGKIDIQGLGGSYGVERIAFYKMLPNMGPPETSIWEFPRGDDSFKVEFEEFLQDIAYQRQPQASLQDAKAAMEIVEKVYQFNSIPLMVKEAC